MDSEVCICIPIEYLANCTELGISSCLLNHTAKQKIIWLDSSDHTYNVVEQDGITDKLITNPEHVNALLVFMSLNQGDKMIPLLEQLGY